MTAARIFALLAALAAGFAIVGMLVGQTGWAAGGAIGAAVALILWGLATALEEPEADQPHSVIWRTTPPFGVERVITPVPVTTELAYRPAHHHRPVWDTDIFGAPE